MPRHTNTRKLQKRRTPMKSKRRNFDKNQTAPKQIRTKMMMRRESEMMHEPMMKGVKPNG